MIYQGKITELYDNSSSNANVVLIDKLVLDDGSLVLNNIKVERELAEVLSVNNNVTLNYSGNQKSIVIHAASINGIIRTSIVKNKQVNMLGFSKYVVLVILAMLIIPLLIPGVMGYMANFTYAVLFFYNSFNFYTFTNRVERLYSKEVLHTST
ncbi:hypothetical protein UA32_12355 [Photobacterium angustum]|uniref:hypothetical protein n=1 Tax=Photobacterium angustum TaxID=661 RepID=UPI0005E6B326|nr:hypothetical protein [Photobacterium angustum]KJG37741.1 hypothetical protein UA32_12355 [Photobacterium angustum]